MRSGFVYKIALFEHAYVKPIYAYDYAHIFMGPTTKTDQFAFQLPYEFDYGLNYLNRRNINIFRKDKNFEASSKEVNISVPVH